MSLSTLNPNRILPASFIPNHNGLFNFTGITTNQDNQLWKIHNGTSTSGVLLQEFIYHPLEERVLIKRSFNSSGGLTETVYYVNENLVRVVNSSGSYDFTYVYHENQLVAQRNPDGSKLFYHPDHLGSTVLVTDESGNIVENTSYSPYGQILTGGTKSRFDYEGKEYDSTTKDYDFHLNNNLYIMHDISLKNEIKRDNSCLQ